MPTLLDQGATTPPTVEMGWVNPPADVTNAIDALRQHCEAWPKTPIQNPFHLVSGIADAACQAATGHAVFVPGNLAEDVFKLGTLLVVAALFLIIVACLATGYIIRQWAKHFPPRTEAKRPPDLLTSTVTLIGFLGWLSAAAITVRYSLGLSEIFLIATALWTLIIPHMVVLLRSKGNTTNI